MIFMLTSLALPSFLAILALLMLLLRRLAPASAKLLRRLKALEGQSRSPIYSAPVVLGSTTRLEARSQRP